MSKVPGPEVSYPSKAFGQYDLAPTKDLCINCEKSNKIIGTITIDKKTGPIFKIKSILNLIPEPRSLKVFS